LNDGEPVHDDNVSQLAINYGNHMKNQQRIKNLMALLSGKSGNYIEANIVDVEIDIGDSMSNIGGGGLRECHRWSINHDRYQPQE
jgi:hypothetical protein